MCTVSMRLLFRSDMPLTMDEPSMLSSCVVSMMGAFLVSRHRKGSYSCSSTTEVFFPLGAACVGGGRGRRSCAVMQPEPQMAVIQ